LFTHFLLKISFKTNDRRSSDIESRSIDSINIPRTLSTRYWRTRKCQTSLSKVTTIPFNQSIEQNDSISFRRSYQTKPVCSSAITALCAMGMVTSDNRISSAALKEMPKLNDPNYTMDVHLLTCLSMFLTVRWKTKEKKHLFEKKYSCILE